MTIAETARHLIHGVYLLSPYAWADRWLKAREFEHDAGTEAQLAWRQKRLLLSERYIGYWFAAALATFLLSRWLPGWIAPLLLLRAVGILNKEMGVVLFGICKITEGAAISATGRVIVLALVNYLTAMFLFATAYAVGGNFVELPSYLDDVAPPVIALLHAAQIHFSLSSNLVPGNLGTGLLSIFHSAYCFLFGTLVISLFVSLLSVKPLQR